MKLSRGARIRLALEDLGPIFVKFGQMLSTRRDLLPDDIALELARLQDRVPPFPSEQARAIIDKAYGQPLETMFAEFGFEPLASASIAQVHVARLHNGREVVVKVVRPGIHKTIRRDIELLYIIAELAQRYWKQGRRLRPVEVVAEYEKTIFDELDLVREPPTPASYGITSSIRPCCTYRKSFGRRPGARCWSWSASAAFPWARSASCGGWEWI
jgi:ubiquinone biosynthesis protein